MNREELLIRGAKKEQKLSFGCVMFDLADDGMGKAIPQPGGGWASIAGRPAFRVSRMTDLANDVRWLSNLPQEVFWKSGLVKQAKLKPSNYLRTEVGQIMRELGLTPPKVQIVKVCESLSLIFSKVMNLATEFYGITDFLQKDLPSEMKEKLYPNDRGISLALDEALMRAYQDLTICDGVPADRSTGGYVTLRRPRYAHASEVLKCKTPSADFEEWEFYSDDDLPMGYDERIAFLMNSEKPYLAKVEILSYKKDEGYAVDVSKVLNLGEAIGEGGKKKERNWVCQPEFEYLQQFMEMNVSAAFMAKEYKDMKQAAVLPNLGELSDFSYSMGILAECLWTGLSSRSVNPQTRSKSMVSPRACWLKALDRFKTFASAMVLHSKGFKVSSYGFGGVTVFVADGETKGLMEAAPLAGLCLPMSMLERRSS